MDDGSAVICQFGTILYYSHESTHLAPVDEIVGKERPT